MAGVKAFNDLHCWQEARILSREIYQRTKSSPFSTDHRLVVQINDSSESVMSNIAEGFGRGTQGEFVQFLGYAIGSLDETRSHLVAAYDRQYLSKTEYESLFRRGIVVRKMIVKLITSMVMPGSGVKHRRNQKRWTDEVWELYERVTGKPRPELFVTPVESRDPPRNDHPPA